jgi:hypothetical protein
LGTAISPSSSSRSSAAPPGSTITPTTDGHPWLRGSEKHGEAECGGCHARSRSYRRRQPRPLRSCTGYDRTPGTR